MELKSLFVADLKDDLRFQSVFRIAAKKFLVGKNGRAYLALELADNTGQIDARAWEQAESLNAEIDVGDYALVKGQVQNFQGRLQVIVYKIDKTPVPEISIFWPKPREGAETHWPRLVELMSTISNQYIRTLIDDTLRDSEIAEALRKSPAARSVHHNWPGGLLEHVLSICTILDQMAHHYPFLNRDLLLFGGLFHDIGKVWELESEPNIIYTNRGRLIGHITIGCELIEKKSQLIEGFPEDLKDILKHLVLAHHGKLEYGSPKRPKFLEALMVSFVDELDSQIVAIKSFMDSERRGGSEWSRYSDQFDRYFLLDDLREKFS